MVNGMGEGGGDCEKVKACCASGRHQFAKTWWWWGVWYGIHHNKRNKGGREGCSDRMQ